MRKFIAIFIISLVGAAAHADSNKLIVRMKAGQDVKTIAKGANVEALIPELGIYAIELPARASASIAAKALRSNSNVVYAQEDHKVTRRNTPPNDKNFSQQWDMTYSDKAFGIDALTAWNAIGQGGKDAAGNDIVVAVVDGGVDLEHEDLKANIWVNAGEIPGNKIDDDGNGYVDDISGWNAYNNSGAVESDYHGTHVAGTVGAVGNNGIGVAGVNWNVKIMAVNGSSGNTSTVLKAYGYVLKQKQLWISSGGKQGANVVATNSSFGVDYGDCGSDTYASWNDIYNEMGKVGILHAIATANMNVDVDKVGDVPTGCDSPYIISVTNTQKDGKKNSGAGYGLTTIDIGAPGTGIYSTIENNAYGTLTGTSMATPHVAGAVAFMHSVGSVAFNNLYLSDASRGALALKELMLKTARPADSMKGKTVSGGILDLTQAADGISIY